MIISGVEVKKTGARKRALKGIRYVAEWKNLDQWATAAQIAEVSGNTSVDAIRRILKRMEIFGFVTSVRSRPKRYAITKTGLIFIGSFPKSTESKEKPKC